MGERFERRPEDRRRLGPLGDEPDSEETRQVPQGGAQEDPDATRQVPTDSGNGPAAPRGDAPSSSGEEKETRVIRAPGSGTAGQEATPYPRGYFEAAEEREDRLRDMYGGVDWLASFLGFIFVLVAGAVFSSIAGLVLVPLGFAPDLGSAEIGAAVITGLVLVAVLIFLAYFVGGYVAGRLARFDGGRNGAMLLVWSFIALVLVAVAGGILSGFLPLGIADDLANLVQNDVPSIIGNLSQLGVVGIVVIVVVLLVALLGGMLGGRLGSRYHTEIDHSA